MKRLTQRMRKSYTRESKRRIFEGKVVARMHQLALDASFQAEIEQDLSALNLEDFIKKTLEMAKKEGLHG